MTRPVQYKGYLLEKRSSRLTPPVVSAGETPEAGARPAIPDEVVSVIWNPTDSWVGPKFPMYSV